MAKVLVVDDEPGYRASLNFFLTRGGHEVLAVANAAQALERASQFEPQVLVADWLLGTPSNGAELARQLRASLPRLQVILITGLDANVVGQKLEGVSIFRVLEKPFEPSVLEQAVIDAAAAHDTGAGPIGP